MKKETLKKIFEFLENKEGQKTPLLWKLFNNGLFTENDLVYNDDLNLNDTYIISLPKGLRVGGDLSLYNCGQLTSLPKGLFVAGDLNLSSTWLETLPKGLQVGGDLYLEGSFLAELSDEALLKMIKPDGYIDGEIIKG